MMTDGFPAKKLDTHGLNRIQIIENIVFKAFIEIIINIHLKNNYKKIDKDIKYQQWKKKSYSETSRKNAANKITHKKGKHTFVT